MLRDESDTGPRLCPSPQLSCRTPNSSVSTRFWQLPPLRWKSRTCTSLIPFWSFSTICPWSTTTPSTGRCFSSLAPTTLRKEPWGGSMTFYTSTIERNSRTQVEITKAALLSGHSEWHQIAFTDSGWIPWAPWALDCHESTSWLVGLRIGEGIRIWVLCYTILVIFKLLKCRYSRTVNCLQMQSWCSW